MLKWQDNTVILNLEYIPSPLPIYKKILNVKYYKKNSQNKITL